MIVFDSSNPIMIHNFLQASTLANASSGSRRTAKDTACEVPFAQVLYSNHYAPLVMTRSAAVFWRIILIMEELILMLH